MQRIACCSVLAGLENDSRDDVVRETTLSKRKSLIAERLSKTITDT